MRRRLLPDACGRRVSWSESVHVARRDCSLLAETCYQLFGFKSLGLAALKKLNTETRVCRTKFGIDTFCRTNFGIVTFIL